MASIFTRIVNGEIPAAKVYEDDLTLAFLDVNPATRGHTLVICKQEVPTLLDLPPELVTALAQTVQRVAQAIMAALNPDGLNVLQNNGSAAGQVVHHYHVHLIPRWEGDNAVRHWRPGSSTPDELREVAAVISMQLGEGGAG
ncbi:HIT family protein [Candidatus Oscillochloris fontis]|uniref:HIT family protein n=1 Tax=Candidatus Oscillochloris fontis TaxID=2496868 RepID=UPI00101D62DD|nr:HIT family protein [Candidatus Oscillochloris fontis]